MVDLWEPVLNRAGRKDKSVFGKLSTEIRNAVIRHLDNGGSLEEAKGILAGHGVDLSIKAVSLSYHKLRVDRQLSQANDHLSSLIGEFGDNPTAESLLTMLNSVTMMAAASVASGDLSELPTGDAMFMLAKLSREMTRLIEIDNKQKAAAGRAASKDGDKGEKPHSTEDDYTDAARKAVKAIWGQDFVRKDDAGA